MANDFIIQVQDFTAPASPDPNKCRIFGFIVDVTGAPIPNSQIHIHNTYVPTIVTDPGADKAVLGQKVIIKSDVNGFVEFDLFRNAQVEILVPSLSPRPFSPNEDKPLFIVTVPDVASLPFMDLIYPVPDILEFLETSPLVLAVSAEEDVKVKLTLTNTVGAVDLTQINLLSSDDTLVTVSAGGEDDDGDLVIILNRLAVGTINITAELNLDAIDPRHQPVRPVTFIVNSVEDANGYEVA